MGKGMEGMRRELGQDIERWSEGERWEERGGWEGVWRGEKKEELGRGENEHE